MNVFRQKIKSVTLFLFFILRFFSNFYESGKGFQLRYEPSEVSNWSYNFGACGGNFTTPQGIITSPSYPENYPDNADCIYTILQPNGTNILLNFISMDIWSHSTCRWDYLEIRDGLSESSTLLNKLCGNDNPAPIQSSSHHLWLK